MSNGRWLLSMFFMLTAISHACAFLQQHGRACRLSSSASWKAVCVDPPPKGTIWQVFPEGTPDIAPSTATGAIGMWSAHSAVFDLRLGSGKQVQAEEVMSVPGAMLLHDVLSREECAKAIILSEAMGYQEHDLLKNTHAAVTWVADLENVIRPLFLRCKPFLPSILDNLRGGAARQLRGLNARLRCYRYQPDGHQTFRLHRDDSFPMSSLDRHHGDRLVWDVSGGSESSVLTFLLYLSDDFEGGHTSFVPRHKEQQLPVVDGVCMAEEDTELVAVKPRAGSVLVFYQTCSLDGDSEAHPMAPLHEGSRVFPTAGRHSSPKYVIRSDVMYSC
uniref:Fe2OG dioxygenase domain-containing protein n=1 Tax=Guillardia theta TaxID=55529 RepID=A0A7S4U9E0_GUITH